MIFVEGKREPNQKYHKALSSLGLVHLGLCPETVLFADQGRLDSVVLAGWGLHHATDGGRLVLPHVFVGARDYAAPEALAPGSMVTGKAAVWAAGVCMLECLTGKNPFADDGSVLAAACRDSDVIRGLLEVPELDRGSRELRQLLMGCLTTQTGQRYDAAAALYSPFCSGGESRLKYEPWPFVRSRQFTAPSLSSLFPGAVAPTPPAPRSRTPSIDTLDGSLPVDSVAFQSVSPPIETASSSSSSSSSARVLAESLLDRFQTLLPELPDAPGPAVAPLVLGQPLRLKWDAGIVCLSKSEAEARVKFKPVILPETSFELWTGDWQQASLDLRERDVMYQQLRVSKLLPLLLARDQKAVLAEAGRDVPPVLRDQVWGILLGLPPWSVCEQEWNAIDVNSETSADHQIAVDVPRCNARHELIGTAEGRKRLTRVLKVGKQFLFEFFLSLLLL